METRKSYQVRALFLKSLSLQLRQKGTNCCQILTPILCLLLVYLMKTIAESQIEENVLKPVQLETIPRFLNPPLVPNYILYNLAGLDVDTCEQWYLYDVPEKIPHSSRCRFSGGIFHSPQCAPSPTVDLVFACTSLL